MITTTNTATTLVTGRSRGRVSWVRIQIGSVCLLPGGEGGDDDLVKRQREGQHPARQQRRGDVGQDHVRKVWKPLAPRSIEASTSEPLVRRKRARRCCRPSTTQNVACPITIVQNENGISIRPMAERSAMPVTMPGSAMRQHQQERDPSRAQRSCCVHRRRRQRAQDHRQRAWQHRHPQRQRASGLPEVRAASGHAQPFEREAGQREAVGRLVGGEGVQDDQPANGRCKNSSAWRRIEPPEA